MTLPEHYLEARGWRKVDIPYSSTSAMLFDPEFKAGARVSVQLELLDGADITLRELEELADAAEKLAGLSDAMLRQRKLFLVDRYTFEPPSGSFEVKGKTRKFLRSVVSGWLEGGGHGKLRKQLEELLIWLEE